jgi:hypothetical protein
MSEWYHLLDISKVDFESFHSLPAVHRERRVCGEPLPNMSAGLHRLALQHFAGQVPFARGVSIGSGTGSKERTVIESGLVEHFTLFELSCRAFESIMKAN